MVTKVQNEMLASGGGGGGDDGTVVELTGAGPHLITSAHDGKTLLITHDDNASVTFPQTSTEAIPTPFIVTIITNLAPLKDLTINLQGADTMLCPTNTAPGTISMIGSRATGIFRKLTAGAPNEWLATGEIEVSGGG